MGGRLIVSLGSRRVAWRGMGKPGAARHEGVPSACFERVFATAPPPDEVVIGSVAAEAISRDLREWCRERWYLEPVELVATSEAHGVRNAYGKPAQLGIDRWAALIAAWKQFGGGVLIADCGTAVTVDYLAEDGRHVGGLIAPGLNLMRAALTTGTRLAPVSAHAPTPPLLGADTELGVSGGALAAVTGFIAYAAAKTGARYGLQRARLLTGGDANRVLPRLGRGWQAAPDLVLDGLELLAENA
jgi:type III pantothenate kinase